MTETKTAAEEAAFYNTAKGHIEKPGDPKPVGKPGIQARKRALRAGRMTLQRKGDPAPEPAKRNHEKSKDR